MYPQFKIEGILKINEYHEIDKKPIKNFERTLGG